MKLKRLNLILIVILYQITLQAQSLNVVHSLFEIDRSKTEIRNNEKEEIFLKIDDSLLKSMRNSQDYMLYLTIPDLNGDFLQLELSRHNIFSEHFKVTLESGAEFVGDVGIHYKGIIKGDPTSLVAISVFEDQISGFISSEIGNFILGKMKNNQDYVLYNNKILNGKLSRKCLVKDDDYESVHFPPQENNRNTKTVFNYIEADYDVFQAFGNTNSAVQYMASCLSQVSIIFDKESIDYRVSEIKVWDQPSPFVPGNDDYPAYQYLVSFRNYLNQRGGFNGNLAHIITTQNIGGGLASGIGTLCNTSTYENALALPLMGDYQTYPTFAWDTGVWAHESGHVMGSYHTHACKWNGNNTQIDDCASLYYYNKGSSIEDLEGADCFNPNNPIIPSNGGFIMSYCDNYPDVGVNLLLGFGKQSGDAIRNLVNAAPCLSTIGTSGLTVTPSQLIFPAKGGCLNLEIEATGNWAIAFDNNYPPTFLSQFPATSGNGNATITLCAFQNTLPVTLGFPMYITDGIDIITIEVYQEGVSEPTALFYPDDKAIAKADGEFISRLILTNTDWKLIQNPYDTWVTIKSPKSGTEHNDFNIEVAKNSTGLNRYSRIGLVYNNALDTTYFIVSQPAKDAGYLNVPSEFTAAVDELQYQFNIYSDLEWEVSSISAGWLEISPLKGKNNGQIIVTVKRNSESYERQGEITFTGKLPSGNISKVLKVNQLKLRSVDEVTKFNVYPNPSSDLINVQFYSGELSPFSLMMYSSEGKLVQVLEQDKTVVGVFRGSYSLENLTQGFYTLALLTKDGIIRKKIIVQ